MAANYQLPKRVTLREDGPREGFQMHSAVIPTEQKLELIHLLATTGVSNIEVASFVRPDLVPQMADAEQVCNGLQAVKDVVFRALYLNQKGFERARGFSEIDLHGEINIAVSDRFLQSNSNTSLDKAIDGIDGWMQLFTNHKIPFERIMLSTSFGYHDEGAFSADHVISVLKRILDRVADNGELPEEVTFADTTGVGNPEAVKRLVSAFREAWPSIEVGLHFHDTRGLGLANVYAGLELGVTRYDCSVAGLGGCPFAKGAAGNVATEDVAYLCQELGIETGVDLERYVECARLAEKIIGHSLPGKLKDSLVVSASP